MSSEKNWWFLKKQIYGACGMLMEIKSTKGSRNSGVRNQSAENVMLW